MAESIRAIPPMVEAPPPASRGLALRPTASEWFQHSALFVITIITTTIAGMIWVVPNPEPDLPEPSTVLGYILYVPQFYLQTVSKLISSAILYPHVLAQGLTFSGALLSILLAHEMGHYVACRRYGVSATLPFFIPAPPLFIAGTFGAFIKIRSFIPTRRALFDIGLAGPLAGFVVVLPVAVAGILSLQPSPAVLDHSITFNDPLLFRLLARAFSARLDNAKPNPYYMAAWIGLLVTSLNLMPVGQLDGGHGMFAVFGLHVHKWIGRLAFVTMATLAVLGWFFHSSPSGFLYTVLLAIMLVVRHPQPQVMEPLGTKRILIAVVTVIVFALSFWPFPITIT
jgi:membrane-associated protease RseP (regulator of RpoE activity)